jgi:hypothetical protein
MTGFTDTETTGKRFRASFGHVLRHASTDPIRL